PRMVVCRTHRLMHQKKRVLFVNDYGLYWPSGMVRAWQYKPLFDQSETWSAEFSSRHSEKVTRLLNHKHRPIVQFLVDTFRYRLAPYFKHLERKREDEIVKRAADFDVVCLVKSSGTQL